MNQVADILKLAAQAQQQNIDGVLVTVVRTEGSAYRRAGAMMLILEDGRSVGMISGGCLEPHIIKRAFWLTRDSATIQVYQTGDEQRDEDEASDLDWDDELNFGLGCNGKVHVLFERLTAALPFLELISKVREDQQPTTVATLIRSNRSEIAVGTRINFNPHLEDNSTVLKPIPQPIMDELLSYKVSKKNADYLVLNQSVASEDSLEVAMQTEWLIQRLQPQIRLLICGAGNDVMPLVTMAKLQDWHVTVVDSRLQYATSLRFPQADKVMQLPLENKDKLLELSANAAVAVMSHSLSQDRARLAILFEHPKTYKYLGQLGPRYRTERLINEISSACSDPSVLTEAIDRLHYPIGYKLGGDGPEALALSIMAQISGVVHEQVAVTKELA